MLTPYPQTFNDAIPILLDFLRGNASRQTAFHAAWHCVGWGLGHFAPDDIVAIAQSPRAAGVESDIECLQSLTGSWVAENGVFPGAGTADAAKAVDWRALVLQMLKIALTILEPIWSPPPAPPPVPSIPPFSQTSGNKPVEEPISEVRLRGGKHKDGA